MLVAKKICSDGEALGEDLLGLPDGDLAHQQLCIGRGKRRLGADEVWWHWLSCMTTWKSCRRFAWIGQILVLVAKWICSIGRLLGADMLGLPDGDGDALEELKRGLMRYGGFGCL